MAGRHAEHYLCYLSPACNKAYVIGAEVRIRPCTFGIRIFALFYTLYSKNKWRGGRRVRGASSEQLPRSCTRQVRSAACMARRLACARRERHGASGPFGVRFESKPRLVATHRLIVIPPRCVCIDFAKPLRS